MIKERWLDISGFEGFYQISDLGRVKSKERYIDRERNNGRGFRMLVREKILKLGTSTYATVFLRKDKTTSAYMVHRLVLEAFVGPCHDGMECRHLNGKCRDNRLVNLEWGTPKQNGEDKIRHGTSRLVGRGERQAMSTLTDDQVLRIRYLFDKRLKTDRELSLMFGTNLRVIRRVLRGLTWKHLDYPKHMRRYEPRKRIPLRADQVKEIKTLLLQNKITALEIAQRIGTTGASVLAIKHGKLYPHIVP